MPRILLISDTHGYLDEGVLRHAGTCDEIWHAGDIGTSALADQLSRIKPFRAVYGNIDDAGLQQVYPENLVFTCESVKVLITHIGGYPGKYPARIRKLIAGHRPQLFICGHSHILKVMYDETNQLLHMNPGACGNQGFHQVKTLLKFEISGSAIKNLAVIELGKRSSVTL